MNYVLLIASVGLCLLWVAWSAYSEGNRRDSTLLATLGAGTMVGSAATALAAG